MSRMRISVTVLALALAVGAFTISRGAIHAPTAPTSRTAHSAQPGPPATIVRANDHHDTPTEAGTDPRARSLAALRGAVGSIIQPCTSSLSGPPVRVFVSSTATVGGGAIRATDIAVTTSAPTPSAFADCVATKLAALSIPAPSDEAGSFPAHMSLLASR